VEVLSTTNLLHKYIKIRSLPSIWQSFYQNTHKINLFVYGVPPRPKSSQVRMIWILTFYSLRCSNKVHSISVFINGWNTTKTDLYCWLIFTAKEIEITITTLMSGYSQWGFYGPKVKSPIKSKISWRKKLNH